MPSLQIQLNGTSYAWSSSMDEGHIQARAAQSAAGRLLTAVTFGKLVVFILLGLLLAYLQGDAFSILTKAFWFEPSWSSLLLYAALLSGVFLFYHQSQVGKFVGVMPSVEDVPEPTAFEETGTHVNLADVYSDEARSAVERAFELAVKFGHKQVEPLHLFVGTMDATDVSVVFGRLGLTFDEIKSPIARRLETRELGKPPVLTIDGERVLLEAFRRAGQEKRREVSSLEVFAASYEQDEFVRELLLDKGVDEGKFHNMIAWLRIHEKMRERYKAFRHAALYKPTGAMNRAMTSVATPMLDAVSEDLTTAAVNGQLPMMIGRDEQVEELFRVIEGGRQSVVLVGPEGVGEVHRARRDRGVDGHRGSAEDLAGSSTRSYLDSALGLGGKCRAGAGATPDRSCGSLSFTQYHSCLHRHRPTCGSRFRRERSGRDPCRLFVAQWNIRGRLGDSASLHGRGRALDFGTSLSEG